MSNFDKEWKFHTWMFRIIFGTVVSFIVASIIFTVGSFFVTHTTHGVVNRIDYQMSLDGRQTMVMVLFEDGRVERFYTLPTQTWMGDIGKDIKYTVTGLGYIVKVEYE